VRLDPEVLARVQFAFTVTFHIIFPTMSIGLAAFLVVIEGLWLKTKEPIYLQIYRFWMGIFAMGFGVGVVTGIVLSFEFGLGFAKFAQIAGPAIGPMIGLEVLTSFFLEAGFFGDYALWAASCRSQASLLRYLHGGARHSAFGVLDYVCQ
jgi:cytochrome d ubiquinol oxidase subunit I